MHDSLLITQRMNYWKWSLSDDSITKAVCHDNSFETPKIEFAFFMLCKFQKTDLTILRYAVTLGVALYLINQVKKPSRWTGRLFLGAHEHIAFQPHRLSG